MKHSPDSSHPGGATHAKPAPPGSNEFEVSVEGLLEVLSMTAGRLSTDPKGGYRITFPAVRGNLRLQLAAGAILEEIRAHLDERRNELAVAGLLTITPRPAPKNQQPQFEKN